MNLNFVKMHGAGNDYIYFDCTKNDISNPEELAVKLSHRNFGIGGDGIILVRKSDVADVKMSMFNLDGSEGKMCGNGIRCVAKFAYEEKIVNKKIITVETLVGVKTLELTVENEKVTMVKVDMDKAELNPKLIPVNLDGDRAINETMIVDNAEYKVSCVSMGNPHVVIFVEDPANIDVEKIGKKFEKNPIFPEGVNTEFIQVVDEKTLKMRVWERGSGETLACGTGACASVVAAVENGFCKKGEDIKVILLGGELIINYTEETVFMTGGCETVFKGVVEV